MNPYILTYCVFRLEVTVDHHRPLFVQDEHKVFPWLQTKCLPGHVGT